MKVINEVNVANDAEWPVQFSKGYAEFYKSFHNEEIIYVSHSGLNAYMPVRKVKGRWLKMGQILHAPVRNAEELSKEEQSKFYKDLLLFLKKEKIFDRLIQPHPSGIMLSKPDNVPYCDFGTYLNYLQEHDPEALLYTYDPKYRKAVQHSIKNGGRTEFGKEQLPVFFELYKRTTERAGIHCDSYEYFEKLYHCLGNEHVDIGVIYDDNNPIGAILMIYSRYAALCTHAGSSGTESKLYGGMKHLHYDMMLRMKNRGVKLYDLVGVRLHSTNPSLEGIFRFKKGFGGILKEGFLWKADINSRPAGIYDWLQRIRAGKHAQFKDIIDQERPLS